MMANSDKPNYVEQRKASGIFTKKCKEAFELMFPDYQYGIKSLQHLSIDKDDLRVDNPTQDDIFFFRTLETVGGLIKDDLKMGAIFSTLILATPASYLSHSSKSNFSLKQVQNEISLLLFRYLRDKVGEADSASSITSRLLMLIGDLQICKVINEHRKERRKLMMMLYHNINTNVT